MKGTFPKAWNESFITLIHKKGMAADLPFFRVFIAFKISSDLISTLTHHLSYLHLVNFLNALAFE
jgi:hypothetical protein